MTPRESVEILLDEANVEELIEDALTMKKPPAGFASTPAADIGEQDRRIRQALAVLRNWIDGEEWTVDPR